MKWIKAVGGVLAGFICMALLSGATTAVLRHFWPDLGTIGQSSALVLLDAGYAILYMLVGGVVASRIGGRPAVYALAAIILLLSVVTAAGRMDVEHPGWYAWLIVLAGATAVLLGGRTSDRHSRAV